ncbi:hypothetical protein RvY_15342 [Ramazzottius varieornatus]|uniref:Mitotic-spindle organizing protein 1 n=1 Tax=Ramazzottius varieornatus TaxID=947166 RepID=A0A1D1VUK1_RAMVA|nr:hypothetical protein RvY_15342 [Ramazzottius varieornatus]
MVPEKAKTSRSAPDIPGKLSSNVTQRSNGTANGTSTLSSTSDWEQQRKHDMKAVMELSNMLRTGLSPEQLEICVNLLESGKVPPRLLADFIRRAREFP